MKNLLSTLLFSTLCSLTISNVNTENIKSNLYLSCFWVFKNCEWIYPDLSTCKAD